MSRGLRLQQGRPLRYQPLTLENDPTETQNLWDSAATKPIRTQRVEGMMERMVDTADPILERKCS